MSQSTRNYTDVTIPLNVHPPAILFSVIVIKALCVNGTLCMWLLDASLTPQDTHTQTASYLCGNAPCMLLKECVCILSIRQTLSRIRISTISSSRNSQDKNLLVYIYMKASLPLNVMSLLMSRQNRSIELCYTAASAVTEPLNRAVDMAHLHLPTPLAALHHQLLHDPCALLHRGGSKVLRALLECGEVDVTALVIFHCYAPRITHHLVLHLRCSRHHTRASESLCVLLLYCQICYTHVIESVCCCCIARHSTRIRLNLHVLIKTPHTCK